MILAVVLSLLSGLALIGNRLLNARLALTSGLKYTTLMNYITGLAATALVFAIAGWQWQQPFPQPELPLIYYLGGFMGVGTVAIFAWITPKVPSLQLTLVVFISQLLFSVLLDVLILQRFSTGQLVGGLIVAAGVVLNTLGDLKDKK